MWGRIKKMSVCQTTKQIQCSANRSAYCDAFYNHAHQLIGMGYTSMDYNRYQKSEETEITGELVKSIQAILEKENSPPWVGFYSVHDDPPINRDGSFGKHRQRVDIKIERVLRGPRPKMQFEAKRLYNGTSVAKYLGKEGLGCFLSGEYARESQEAGMLGYVQVDNESAWADKIKKRIEKNPKDYFINDNGEWNKTSIIPKLKYSYRTAHNRSQVGSDIGISHILLKFCN